MPVYVYKCRRCKRQVELTQRITDPPFTTCEDFALTAEDAGEGGLCGGELFKIPVTTGRPLLKGGGWEKDGYR